MLLPATDDVAIDVASMNMGSQSSGGRSGEKGCRVVGIVVTSFESRRWEWGTIWFGIATVNHHEANTLKLKAS
jgi:hypothetical protein